MPPPSSTSGLDPRVAQLLAASSSPRSGSASNGSKSHGPRSKRHNQIATAESMIYNPPRPSPAQLLNPKSASLTRSSRHQPFALTEKPEKTYHKPHNPAQRISSSYMASSTASRSSGSPSVGDGLSQNAATPDSASEDNMNPGVKRHLSEGKGLTSMLESLHSVEQRVDQPQKKVKKIPDREESNGIKHSYLSHRTGGIVGEYMRPDPSEAKATKTAQTVDLTNDDDGDDVVITGQVNLERQEVCYGHVVATVLTHKVPKPGKNSPFAVHNEWPVSKCTLKREPAKDMIIDVLDPHGQEFGRINPEMSLALAPLLDTTIRIRTQPRLVNRRKKKDEWPGQPCSDTLRMIINIYGPRGDAALVGKMFGHRNIWFRPPMASDAGVPIHNPHAEKRVTKTQLNDIRRQQVRSETRTNEESAAAVTKLFDHFASSAHSLECTETPSALMTPLLEHQQQALTFLLKHEKPRTYGSAEAENSSLWRLDVQQNGAKVYKEIVAGISQNEEPDEVLGGLLADVMGLGKTIETLALMVSTLDEARQFSVQKMVRESESDAIYLLHTKGTLLVVPLSAIKNWEDQIREHVKEGMLTYYVYHGPNRIQNAFEMSKYDIVISTYGTVATEFSGKAAKGSNSPLRQLKWFRIVLDEAHTIRESKATQSQAMYSLWAQRRWCLTGTPIQNRIDDLGSLTKFLRLYPYDNAFRFNQYIRGPAQAGDGSFLPSLRVFVDSFTLRRLKDRVDLPRRDDLVELLEFSEEEEKLHAFFKEQSRVNIETLTSGKRKEAGRLQHHVLQGIMTLRLICAHGKELLKEKDLEKLRGSTATDAIDLEEKSLAPKLTEREAYEHLQMMADADLDRCRECSQKIGGDSPQTGEANSEDNRGYVLPCYDVVCNECFGPYKDSFGGNIHDPVTCPFCSAVITPQYIPITTQGTESIDMLAPESPPQVNTEAATPKYYGGPHTKTRALLRDLQEMREASKAYTDVGDPPLKSIIFSEFTSHLDLIERALTDNNFTFVRIDGKMSLSRRRKVLDDLSTNDNVTILLASIKAAGQGLNLTSASRAFIMEPMWNPAAEAQAVDRIYRIGQKREVIIKRFQMAKSIELKIVELQKKKQALADVTMERNHKQLSKKETREQHMKEILALFK